MLTCIDSTNSVLLQELQRLLCHLYVLCLFHVSLLHRLYATLQAGDDVDAARVLLFKDRGLLDRAILHLFFPNLL